jgi:hypothetical protein
MTPYKWIAQTALNMIDCFQYDDALAFLSKSLAYGLNDDATVGTPMWDHLDDAKFNLQTCYGIIRGDIHPHLKDEDPWTLYMDKAVSHLKAVLNS